MIKPAVRKGQIWRRKKDGVQIIINSGHGDEWFTHRQGQSETQNKKITHHITRFDLQKFWELIPIV